MLRSTGLAIKRPSSLDSKAEAGIPFPSRHASRIVMQRCRGYPTDIKSEDPWSGTGGFSSMFSIVPIVTKR